MSNVPMTRPEEALAIHETSYFHSSSFVSLEDGRILHAANTTFTSSDDGGLTWSAESQRHDIDGNLVGGGGTSLVKLSGNGIGLAAMKRGTGDPRVESFLVFWRSEDAGETWEAPVRITDPGFGTHAYQDVFLRTSSGRIILPVYVAMGQGSGVNEAPGPATGKLVNNVWVGTGAHFFDRGFGGSYVCYSDDDGRTWQRNKDGELIILLDWNASYAGNSEPTVAEVSPGILLMMVRTILGRHFQAWSYDNGETWTRLQPSSLAASTTPAQIRSIPETDHLLVIWNQESETEIKRGYNRTRMSSAVSRNGGSVWEFFQNIESIHETTRVEPGPIRPVRPEEQHYQPGTPAPERDPSHILQYDSHVRWSYPSVLVTKDRVLVAHTYTKYEPHPTKAELDRVGGVGKPFNQKLKVLPLTWFYGGKEPTDNPFFPRAHDPAQP